MVSLLLLFMAIPQESAAIDQVDLIEVNHLYDQQGRHVIDQLIFWDWDRDRFQIRAWRLIKSDSQLPLRDWNRGGYVCYWRDGQQLRKVYAPQRCETWTSYDPEVRQRELLPLEQRAELSRVR
ncbi:hypothetical protein [Blastopirellula marina]|uniref:Uncharacterized protein n=1 Tax=Blastopirellula marina DSM 3645 TaxID=314230 RepID=A3ZPJ9_9BACT|nr:hypothetical protein [Blastopirellula marina]EAQ81677.1 hypothetical protein DSM3645_28887 [Blastopirellula marina DSM 3645]